MCFYSHMYAHLKIKINNLENTVSSCSYSFIFSFYQTSFPVSCFIDFIDLVYFLCKPTFASAIFWKGGFTLRKVFSVWVQSSCNLFWVMSGIKESSRLDASFPTGLPHCLFVFIFSICHAYEWLMRFFVSRLIVLKCVHIFVCSCSGGINSLSIVTLSLNFFVYFTSPFIGLCTTVFC